MKLALQGSPDMCCDAVTWRKTLVHRQVCDGPQIIRSVSCAVEYRQCMRGALLTILGVHQRAD
jgi:hypothetical protein